MLMKIATLRRSWLVLSLLAGAYITGLTPLRSLAQEQPAESGRLVSVEIEVWQLDGLPKTDREEIYRNGNLARLQTMSTFLEAQQKRGPETTKLLPPKHVKFKIDGRGHRCQFAIDAESTWELELRPAPIGAHEVMLDYDLVRRAGGEQVQVSGKQQVRFGSVAACRLQANSENNKDETATEWLVFLRPRLRNPDESDVVIPVDIGREAGPSSAAFIPRAGIYQLQVAEGWSGYLWAGPIGQPLFSLSGSTNIGKSADARPSDNYVPLETFRAERPVLEVVYSDDGFIQVVARRPGFASLRSQILEPDGQFATCELQIVVAADTTEIDQAIRTVLPRANIKTAMVRDALLLTGTIADADELSLLDEVAGQFAPKIINRVKVAGERLHGGKTTDFPLEPAAASVPAGPQGPDLAPRQISSAAVEPSRARPRLRRRDAAELKAIHDEVRGLRDDVRKLSELLERRLTAESAPKPVRDDRIQIALNKIVAVEFRDTPLDEVLRKFGELMEVNVVLDTRSLDEMGLKPTAPVSIVMSGVSARSALKLILEPLNLAFMEESEVLRIVSRQRSKGELIIKTYSVEQLQPIFHKRQPGQSRTGALEELRQLIVHAIQPDSWDEFGGPASIRVHAETDSLVVRQTSDVHAAIVELLEQIRRLKQLPQSADKTSDTQLLVISYAIADLVVPIPGAEGLTTARTTGWLNVYDRLITEISPHDWKDNGGQCSIEVHEQTLSLIIRATRSIHEQVAELLDATRREHDVQVCIEHTFLPPLSDSVLQQAGLKLEFDPRTKMVQIDEQTARQLIAAVHQSNQEIPFAPKITLFNGQIGHLKWQDWKLYVRALVADNRESVRLNVAVNPNNPEIAMTRNSQRLPNDSYLLVDITDHQPLPDPRTKPRGRSLVLLHPRIIQPEEVQEPKAHSDAVKP